MQTYWGSRLCLVCLVRINVLQNILEELQSLPVVDLKEGIQDGNSSNPNGQEYFIAELTTATFFYAYVNIYALVSEEVSPNMCEPGSSDLRTSWQLITAIIISVWIIRENLCYQDWWNVFLGRVYISRPRITGWHIAHVATYFLVASLLPTCTYALITGGILWECF